MDIRLASTEEETITYANQILEQGGLWGFDTEDMPVSLIQLSSSEICYLFRIKDNINKKLVKVLENPFILKVGVDATTDVERLHHYDVNTRGVIDIQPLALSLGDPSISLEDLGKKYIPNFLGKDKLGHKGDWNALTLTPSQLRYATLDAYHSLLIYCEILGIPCPKRTVTVDNSEELLRLWVGEVLAGSVSHRNFDSMVSQVVNSFAPWRKIYLDRERRLKAQAVLYKFIEDSFFPYDKLRNLFLVTPQQAAPVEVTEEMALMLHNEFLITKVFPIKRKALVAVISNSYSVWSKIPVPRRVDAANTALAILIRKGLLRQDQLL